MECNKRLQKMAKIGKSSIKVNRNGKSLQKMVKSSKCW